MARRRPVKACTECKQVKLRCDASESFPRPCARCVRRELVCVIDSSFKRTPARLRLQNVTNELRQLKQSLHASKNGAGGDESHFIDPAVEDADSRRSPSQRMSQQLSPNGKPILDSPFWSTEGDDSLSQLREVNLEDCVFQGHELRDLFSLFYVAFHPHLPVVDTRISASALHETSPFLFWTILFTASRHHKEYVMRANQLTVPYSNLLGRTMLRTPHSLHTIQAILIMCMWPLPVMYQPEDPSLMYSTIAMQASHYLGLQRSVGSSSRSLAILPQDDRQAMSRTWLGCFAIHTALSISHGNPPMVKSPNELSVVEANLEKHHIPQRLAFEVEVQRCMARYHDCLVGGAEPSVHETLVQMCEQELTSVNDRYRGTADAYFALHLDTTRLHLYTLALLNMKSRLGRTVHPDTKGHVTGYQQLGMLAAHRLIDIYCDGISSSDTRLIDVYRALPKQVFVGVLLATFFLLRYFVLNPACQGEQKAESRNKVLMVHAKLKEFTSHRFAEPGRAAAVIEVLCRHGEAQISDTSEEIDDRGVASISWSALIAASNIRGKVNLKTTWLQKINPSSPDLRSDQQQSTTPEAASQGHSNLESFEQDYPIPENIWDQSFLQMLDFSAYDLDSSATDNL